MNRLTSLLSDLSLYVLSIKNLEDDINIPLIGESGSIDEFNNELIELEEDYYMLQYYYDLLIKYISDNEFNNFFVISKSDFIVKGLFNEQLFNKLLIKYDLMLLDESLILPKLINIP